MTLYISACIQLLRHRVVATVLDSSLPLKVKLTFDFKRVDEVELPSKQSKAKLRQTIVSQRQMQSRIRNKSDVLYFLTVSMIPIKILGLLLLFYLLGEIDYYYIFKAKNLTNHYKSKRFSLIFSTGDEKKSKAVGFVISFLVFSLLF